MKKVIICLLFLFSVLSVSIAKEKFYVYKDAGSKENHFCPTGWMGATESMTYSQRIFIQPATGKQCIRITYDPKNDQGWAGIYWTDWKNPWGDNPNGYDLSNYKKLHFIARGENGGETIDFIKVGGISGRYPDSGSCDLGGLLLTKKWHKYSFDLDGDLSFINGGFMLCFTSDGKNGIQTVYVDEICFE